MSKRQASGDLHIVIKRFRDSFGQANSSDDNTNDEPGSIRLSKSHADDIVGKLNSIESLLKRVAESKASELAYLEEHTRQRQCDEIVEEEALIEASSYDTPDQDNSVQSTPSKSKCEARYADGFPLQTLQDVIDLDHQMGEEEEVKNRVERFLEMNKQYARERFTRAFSLFVTDECLNTMTWTGHRDKFEFRSLKNIVDAMWRIWFDFVDYGDFEREMKAEIAKTHCRLWKRKARK